MKWKFMRKKGSILAFLLVFASAHVLTANNQSVVPLANGAQTIDHILVESDFSAMHPDQKLVHILTVFLCKFHVRGHFTKFVRALIAILEDATNASYLKNKFGSMDIQKIINMLKSVQNDNMSPKIAFKLRNYMDIFPEELKAMVPNEIRNMGGIYFTKCISKRLNDNA